MYRRLEIQTEDGLNSSVWQQPKLVFPLCFSTFLIRKVERGICIIAGEVFGFGSSC
jgi:hypothetical protein